MNGRSSGLIVADARTLYGPGRAAGEGGGMPALSMVPAGEPAGRPAADVAPRSARLGAGLWDDPTFWMLATLGAGITLAIAAARSG